MNKTHKEAIERASQEKVKCLIGMMKQFENWKMDRRLHQKLHDLTNRSKWRVNKSHKEAIERARRK